MCVNETDGHKFNYYVGKQALCQNFLQNIFKAGCQIHGGVFLNKFSNLHRAHPLLISRNSPDHHDFVCLVWALEILVLIELLTIWGNRITLIISRWSLYKDNQNKILRLAKLSATSDWLEILSKAKQDKNSN